MLDLRYDRIRWSPEFETDPYPGKPKILFIGYAESTHTHTWISLLDDAQFNVRVFALPSNLPPDDWPIRTYITTRTHVTVNSETRIALYALADLYHFITQVSLTDRIKGKILSVLLKRPSKRQQVWDYINQISQTPLEKWLALVIKQWQPDIIHTLGLDPAGFLYFDTRNQFGLKGIGQWVQQLRGGSDLELARLDPEIAPRIQAALNASDQIITDNHQNPHYLREMGIEESKFAPINPVPGTGGVDVKALSASWQQPPAQRRIILWPKAYESPWSVALPVFEALKLCWGEIQPCEIHMLAMYPNTSPDMWYWKLPEEIRKHCYVSRQRVPREQVLRLMTQARVLLAPSLIDGVPNSMYEAMASGAFPIVSPLVTITPVVKAEENVLFAHNLYPEEIAKALIRAMNEDDLIDRATQNNLELVKNIADRKTIAPRVVDYYHSLHVGRMPK